MVSDMKEVNPAVATDEEGRRITADPEDFADDFLLTSSVLEEVICQFVFLDELLRVFRLAHAFDGNDFKSLSAILLVERLEAWQLHAAASSCREPEGQHHDLAFKR